MFVVKKTVMLMIMMMMMLMIMMIRRRNNFLGSRIISNWLLAPPGHWQHVGYEGHDDVVENRFELQRHHRVRMRMVVGGS